MASEATSSVAVKLMPSGPGAAAVLAAGIGCFALGVISVLADKLPAFSRAC